jgi:hypothetical protein
MKTKYDIGDTVFIKARILQINICEEGTEYKVAFDEATSGRWMLESDLIQVTASDGECHE